MPARRLLDAGYDRHEVLHMLACPMAGQIHATLTGKQPYDHARHVAALHALPASWEPERAQTKARERPPPPVPWKQTAPMKPAPIG